MTGSLQKKSGKYYIVLNLISPNGKRYQKWIATGYSVTGGNKKKAEKLLQFTLNQCENAECQGPATLSHFLDTIDLSQIEAVRFEPVMEPARNAGGKSETSRKSAAKPKSLPSQQTPKSPVRSKPTDISKINEDTLFSDAVRLWMKDCEKRIDEVTFQGYTISAKNHVLPYFDNLGITIGEVNRPLIQEYFDWKHEYGRMDGKGGLSTSSLKRIKTVIYQTLQIAVREEIIPSNPCALVKLPSTEPFQAKFYTAEQITELLDLVKDDILYPTIKLTSVYGLRRSEVLGLKWDSVDFVSGLITIKHTVAKVTTTIRKDKTKNQASHRSFPLLPEIRELLLKLKEEEEKNRILYGRAYNENDYILKWDNGTPISPDFVSSHFRKLLIDHNMPIIRFHELRHSCASILLNEGCTLKDVQEWMGHADIKMTANIYGHLDVTRKHYLAETMASSIFKSSSKKNEEMQ